MQILSEFLLNCKVTKFLPHNEYVFAFLCKYSANSVPESGAGKIFKVKGGGIFYFELFNNVLFTYKVRGGVARRVPLARSPIYLLATPAQLRLYRVMDRCTRFGVLLSLGGGGVGSLNL